jgi:hypothetical protein
MGNAALLDLPQEAQAWPTMHKAGQEAGLLLSNYIASGSDVNR